MPTKKYTSYKTRKTAGPAMYYKSAGNGGKKILVNPIRKKKPK